jgi:Uncharacterized conserved protein (DUF2190)
MGEFFPGGGATDISGKMDTDGNNGAITYTNFTPSAAPTYQEGRVWYDSDTKALSFYDDHSGTSIQIGKELVVDARNNTGSQINNGQVVYISGATGQHPTIALARANAIATSEVIGIATHDIANNTIGKVTISGLINDIDTSAFSDGDALYVSATTAGAITATPPASPNFVATVGYVAHAHATQGKILVLDKPTIANNNSLGTSQSISTTENAIKTYVDTAVAEARPTNVLINGAMAIDQRNEGAAQTITAAAAKAYTVDRWYAYCTGANVTGQRVAGSAQSQYRYRFTGATGNTAIQFGQRIEAANSYHLNGQICTLSVDLASTSITTVTWTAFYANTTDTFGTIASPTRTQIATGTFTITSSIARYSAQISIPSAATTGIEIVFSVGALLASQTWTIGNVQLEAGSVATPFGHMPVSLIRQMCLRYYQVISRFTKIFDSTLGSGVGATHGWSVQYPVMMRLTPTASLVNTSGANYTFLSLTGTTAEATVVQLAWLTDGVVARSVGTDIILEAEL